MLSACVTRSVNQKRLSLINRLQKKTQNKHTGASATRKPETNLLIDGILCVSCDDRADQCGPAGEPGGSGQQVFG